MKKTDHFWIYMLLCSNGHFYTGYCDNLVRRYAEHKMGSAKSKYTRSFKPVKIAQCWRLFGKKGMALSVESRIKAMPRKLKEKIVKKPGKLKIILHNELNMNLGIFTFDPKPVEKKSMDHLDAYKDDYLDSYINKKIRKNIPDPFVDYPQKDL